MSNLRPILLISNILRSRGLVEVQVSKVGWSLWLCRTTWGGFHSTSPLHHILTHSQPSTNRQSPIAKDTRYLSSDIPQKTMYPYFANQPLAQKIRNSSYYDS